MSSRREKLAEVDYHPGFHAGLWLDRYLRDVEEKGEGKQEHLDALLGQAEVPEVYRLGFRRWREAILALPPHTAWAEVAVLGRMAVGLGAESVLETALALHHTYGVPYLPASGLKGLAAAAAHLLLEDRGWRRAVEKEPAGEGFRTLFGDTESSGFVTFHDGLFIPQEGKLTLPFQRDVMTVHHPEYYQGSQEEAPTEWDNPTPIAFLSTGGTYLVAVTGPEAWAQAGLEILLEGLKRLGAGAKTGSGYGRMRVVAHSLAPEDPAEEPETEKRPEREKKPSVVYRKGETVEIQVTGLEDRKFRLVVVATGEELQQPASGQPWPVGTTLKLKVKEVGGDGRLKRVG